MSLKNQTVIVTGSTRGIGAAIALAFAEAGANIVLNGRKNVPADLVAKIESLGAECLCVLGDVAKENDAEKLIKTTKENFGSVDILVNNAGITRDKLLMRMSEEEFTATFEVNLKGTFNTIKHVSNIMLKQKSGTIINMASIVGEIGNIGQGNYAASKAGVIALTKTAARELASRGITVNAIAPGFIETDMTDVLTDKIKEQMKAQIPLQHFGQVEDIARVALFLSENRYITGQVINVDGGMVMQG